MKKIAIIFLFAGFFSSFLPLQALEGIQSSNRSELQEKQELKQPKKKKSTKKREQPNALQLKEQKKKEIEAREHSVDRHKKVKRNSTDENLPETVRERNIP